MKKTLSSVVSIALISSMFATAAFAAETTSTPETTNTSVSATKELTTQEKYDALKAAGVFEGDDTGANLEGLTDRAQIAKIIAKAFELSENASGASVYKDEAFGTPEFSWSLGFVGAVTKAGLMDGVWEGVFDPKSNVTHEQIATILVKAFKLEHPATEEVEGEVSDWAKGYVAAAIKEGLIKAQADYTVAAKRSDLVESAWTAIEKYKESQVPVVTAKLTGASGLTNSKVKIAFDAEVKAIDKSSISVKDDAGAAVEVKGVTLAADGKSAVVTTVALNGYNKYTLTLNGVTKNFVALGVDSDKPVAQTAVIGQDAAIKVTFNEAVDAATATNVANYVLDPSVEVKSATLSSDGTVVTVVTAPQEMGKTYKFSVQNVTDLSGNSVDKTEFYVGGVVDNVKPTATVVVNYDATITVSFSEKVKKDTAENVSNYVIDPAINVKSATLNSDGDKVVLVTDAQELAKTYKITVQNVADLAGNVIEKADSYFGGIVDTQKPTAFVTNNGDGTLNIKFSEKVNKEQAENVSNYTVDTGLAIKSAKLNDTGDTVTLETDKQENSKTYKLTIQNIADRAASPNVIEKADHYFGGIVDTAGPEITSAASNGATSVTLYFNERLNKEIAEDPTNYFIDGDLKYPTKAVYDDTARTVKLTTAKQTAGKLYNVTVNNLKDKSGNVIASNAKKSFGGTSSGTAAQTKFLQVSTVNQNTIDLVFDQEPELSASFGVEIAKFSDNSTVTGLTYAYAKQSDNKKIVRVQFKTSTNTNPALFEMGTNYKATVSGVTNLVTDNSANAKVFSGTSIANVAPKLEYAVAVNNTSVKVRFTEDVKFNVDPASVTATTYGQFKIGDLSITGIQTDISNPVREVVLNLGSSLVAGQTYTVSLVNPTIKDAANYNAIQSDSTAPVSGTTVTNEAPKIISVNTTDKHNFDIVFSEAVNGAEDAEYETTVINGNGSNLTLINGVNATFKASDDKKKLTISIWNQTGVVALDAYSAYNIKLKDSSVVAGSEKIRDLQNTPLKAADNKTVALTGTPVSNAQPFIAAVDAVISGADKKTLTLKATFSEKVSGAATLEVTIGGLTQTVAVNVTNDDKATFVINTTDALTAGGTGTIKVVSTGNSLVDINKQAAKTDAITFATK